jgi:hypothetical protein
MLGTTEDLPQTLNLVLISNGFKESPVKILAISSLRTSIRFRPYRYPVIVRGLNFFKECFQFKVLMYL